MDPKSVMQTVARVMRAAGLEVVERGLPRIDVDGGIRCTGIYLPARHRIIIHVDAGASTLAHEMCHALQPDDGGSSREEDPNADWDAYRWSQQEREAFAVGRLFFLAEQDPRWIDAAEKLQGAGIDALEYMVGITGTATKRHGRRARITANAAKRSVGLLK